MDNLDIIEACLQDKSNSYILPYITKKIIWRYGILKIHNFTCRLCNNVFIADQLEAHHVLPVRLFPHLEFDINNGVPLCLKCHPKTYRKELLFVSLLTPYLKQQVEVLNGIDKEKLKALIKNGYDRILILIKKIGTKIQ